MAGEFERVLRVYSNRSEYESKPGQIEVFEEGASAETTRERYRQIIQWFDEGHLQTIINEIRASPEKVTLDNDSLKTSLDGLVDAVTSERGRALVALTVMQLAVKTACPEQCVRLHKSSLGGTASNFSWTNGISMRSLDRQYVTPVLRSEGLMRLNSDGFMMTRSLAENYPYTPLYKAALRGGREQWLNLTDAIEDQNSDTRLLLRYLLSLLINRSDRFTQIADSVLQKLDERLTAWPNIPLTQASEWVLGVVENAEYSARLFEIGMHSLFQALEMKKLLPSPLSPLSQMRSANKKHGNIGDIELLQREGYKSVIESWDAKFAKPYLRDELEELDDKLKDHQGVERAGFVTSADPNITDDIETRRQDLEAVHGVFVQILSFHCWASEVSSRFNAPSDELGEVWLRCFVESVAQKRRDIAPIDEPCEAWLRSIKVSLEQLHPPA